jgi:threonine/homoserine/homoserine lactone efflux protein
MIGRLFGFALLGFVVLAILFAVLIVMGIAMFGLAMVRADAFALFVALYWFGGAALVLGGAWFSAKRQGGEP